MIINVLNKDLIPVTFIDNDIPGLPSYYKDTLIDYLSLGTSSFEFTILKSKNNIIQDYSRFFNDETCFSFEKNGKQYAVFPAGSDGFYETDTEITYKCLSLDRELSLEYVDKFDNSSTHTLQWYIDYFELISNNQIEIGRNDVADYTRVIKYDSQDTKLNRLLSLINNFDAEFEFITKLTNNGAVDKIILNIVKKRDDSGNNGIGIIRNDVELVYGKNVKGIERTYNFEFFNASKVTGKDGLNWNSSEFSYINDDGIEEFYKRKGVDTAYAPLSSQKYPAHLRKDSSDIWIRKNFETEYTTANQMWGYIVQQFKSYAYPQITYKVKTSSTLVTQTFNGRPPIQIGDTVTIEDDNFSNDQGDFGLILKARATEIKSSDSNPETNEITFENFVELQNDLSDDLMAQVNQLVDAATPYIGSIDTTNGTQFKNGTGSTTLSAHIYKGSATTETIADSYEWSKDGTVVANAQTITVDASGVVDKAVYSFKATVGGKVVGSQSVTITNVDDGIAGKTSYTHVAYANSADGKDSFTTVYPNLNLFTGTSDKPSTKTGNYWNIAVIGVYKTPKVGQKYTVSVEVPNADHTVNIEVFRWNNAGGRVDVLTSKRINSGEKGYVTFTWPDPGNSGATQIAADLAWINGTDTGTYSYCKAKLEPGLIATPYMQSASEVTTADWPKYIGHYTDFTQADSTNPSDYTWSLIRGNDGKDGANGKDGLAGKDGVGIKNTVITYAISTSGTTAPTTDWTSSVPSLVKGQYLWTKTVWTYTDNSSETGYSVTYIAKDGNNGNDGIAGKDGTGIKTTTITYAGSTSGTIAPASGWTSTVPTVEAGSYLWTKTVWTYTDNSSETGYSVAMMGVKGDKGDTGNDGRAGKDGNGIKTTVITYTLYSSSTVTPANGWTSQVPTLVKGQYLWTKTVWTYTDNSSETGYSVSYIAKDGNNGNDGIAGKDGVGLINTTLRYAKSKDGVNKPEGRIVASFTDKFIPALSSIDNLIMTGKQVHLEQGKTYILSAETNGVFTNVHNVEQSNNATIWIVNPSFSTWDIISDTNTAIGTKYTHNRPTGDYEIRINSYVIDNSIWVKNIVFEDGTWTPDIPVANPGEYLWTRTIWFYSDNTNETGFSVAKMGEQGPKGDPGHDGIAGKDGNGIKTTVTTYAISTSGTTAPNTGWTSSVPGLIKGQFLWTKTVWTYTDNSSETGYSVSYISKDGNNGNDGIAGKDGVGIKTTVITYASHTNGTTPPTTGYTTTVPSVPAGQFLWTKTVWTYTDNSSETGYSVAMMGLKGDKGDRGDRGIQGLQGPDGTQGIPGPKGADGTDAPTITVKSYTNSAGSGAKIELTGPNAFKQTVYNRGHNVWVIDATTHELKEFVSCDTYVTMSFSHNGVSTTLADYLTSLKDSIVVIAASDADAINQNVRDVLNSMGGFPDFGTWGGWRYGHVFIGMSKRNDGTWPLQPRQGYEEVIKEDGSAPEIGCTLSKGGIVAKGADGKTQYTHIAYANSADGWKDFSTSDSNRTYIGMYVDFNSNDSTTPSDYSWTLVKGADGTQGIPGKPGADGRTPYFHTAWSNSADGTLDFNPDYKSAVGLDILNITNWEKNWQMSHSTYNFVSNTDSSFKVTGKGTGGWEVLSKSFPTKVGDKLRFTVRYTNRQEFAKYDGYGLQFVANDVYTERFDMSSKIVLPNTITEPAEYQLEYTATTDNVWMGLNFGNVGDWSEVDFDIKIEVENLTNPVKYIYIGTYSDHTATDSTKPSDYTWSLMRGHDSYTHTAYSYSADGTDRFTTSYPNLNLLEGSNSNDKSWILGGNGTYTGQYVPFNGGYKYNFTYTRASTDWAVYMFSGLQKDKFKPDTDYVLSFMANVSTDIKPNVLFANAPAQHNFVNQLNKPTILSSDGDQKVVIQLRTSSSIPSESDQQLYISGFVNKVGTFSIWDLKIDPGATATPYIKSANEVKTSDYPNYIGQRTDDKKDDSTNPSDYTWSLIRGNDGKDGANGKDGLAGKDGVGIKNTVITYAISTSGTTAPTTDWTSSVPSLVKGQYLWTKTVWTYTDNSSETGYSVTYIAKDGNNGNDGIAGKDGTGIKTTTITYAGSTSGTIAPASGWTSTVPTVEAGSYLWTKTVWAYTDNTSETGYSVAKMGNNGTTGPQGPPGSNGDPGKTVSNTEPSTRFKGLTWKYSGTTDLTASDGTVIKPNTEYYYNGNHWVINYFSVNNFAAESITSDKIDGKNLTITDGEFVSTTTNGPVITSTEIKDNHIAISKTDGTVNTRNDIALDSEQGLAQKFTNINTGFYRTAGINYQGPFTSDSDGNYAQLTPQGTKLSTDVPWTKLSLMNNFNGNIEYAIINGTVYISASGVGVPAMTAGQWKQAAQLPTGSSAIPIRANRIAAGDSGDGLSWALLSNQAGGIFIRCSANKAPTANLFNATLPYPIG